MLNPDRKLEILTLKQVAKYLQATDSTIYRLATEKKFLHLRLLECGVLDIPI